MTDLAQHRATQLAQVEATKAHLASLPRYTPRPFELSGEQLADLAPMRPLERRYALGRLYYAWTWHEKAREHYPNWSLSHGGEKALQRWWNGDVETRLDEAEAVYAAAVEGNGT